MTRRIVRKQPERRPLAPSTDQAWESDDDFDDRECCGCSERDGCATTYAISCLALVLGAALLTVGGFALERTRTSETDRARNARIGALRAAASAWESKHRGALEELTLQLTVRVGGEAQIVEFTRSEAADGGRSPRDRAKELPTWRPLKFVAGPLTVPIAAAAATSSHYNATLDFLFLRGGANPSRFTMRSIEFGSRSSTRTLSWKECVNRRHGQFHGANCTTTRLLSSLCLAVGVDERGAVTPPDPASPGCYHRTAGGGLSATTYRTVGVPAVRPHAAAAPATIGPLSIIVRSTRDPWLAATNLTHGSFAFGPTARELQTRALAMLGSGVFLVALALIVLVFLRLGCCRCPTVEYWCCCFWACCDRCWCCDDELDDGAGGVDRDAAERSRGWRAVAPADDPSRTATEILPPRLARV